MQLQNRFDDVLLSAHSRLRMAQRAIPPRVVHVLLAIGKREHDDRGALRIHLRNKAAQQSFLKALGAEAASRYRDVYAVLRDDGSNTPPVLITVGRLRRGYRANH